MEFNVLFNLLFNAKIEPLCAYCKRGKTVDGKTILCRKKGVMAPEDSCPAFRYDPLKRVPPPRASLDLSRFRDEDFTL